MRRHRNNTVAAPVVMNGKLWRFLVTKRSPTVAFAFFLFFSNAGTGSVLSPASRTAQVVFRMPPHCRCHCPRFACSRLFCLHAMPLSCNRLLHVHSFAQARRVHTKSCTHSPNREMSQKAEERLRGVCKAEGEGGIARRRGRKFERERQVCRTESR